MAEKSKRKKAPVSRAGNKLTTTRRADGKRITAEAAKQNAIHVHQLVSSKRRPLPKDSLRRVYNHIQGNPVWFTEAVLGHNLWNKQAEIIESVKKHKRTSVKACHGVGKSFIAGNCLLWFLYGHGPSIILSTAPTWRQVEKLVWKEVRSSYGRARVDLGGKLSPKKPELQLIQDQWYASGLSTNDPDKFQGFHEENVLIIVDEAAGVEDAIFEGIEGILSSDGAKILMIGNPTSVSGCFYDSFKDKRANKISISCFDSPNFTWSGITESDIINGTWEKKEALARSKNNGKLIHPKMVSPEWVRDKYEKWGPTSSLYLSKVKGEFPTQEADSLIPLNWIEAAMERWYELKENPNDVDLGVDVAEFGDDDSVIATRMGRKCRELELFHGLKLVDYAGVVTKRARELRVPATKGVPEKYPTVKVDVIGMGTGVEGIVKNNGIPTIRVNVAEAPGGEDEKEMEEMKELFLNKRAQLWWNLRERLNPDKRANPLPIGLPPDDDLRHDLVNIKYKINLKGRIVIESKDDFRKRVGRSPDRGDAVMMAFATPNLLGDGEWDVNIR